MSKTKPLTDLRFLFRVVALLELAYASLALLVPAAQVTAVTGWVLTPDGVWIVRILGVALGVQAWLAWKLRDDPPVVVAQAFALYQLGSATADWVSWILLADQGVFSTALGRIGVLAAVPSHYLVGVLLLIGIRRSSRKAVQ